MGECILFIDGASNFRGANLGIILKFPQGDILPQTVSYEFNATKNEEEYVAPIMGLQLDNDLHIKDL